MDDQATLGVPMSKPEHNDQELSQEDITRISAEAYCYLYPLVLMVITRRQMTNTVAWDGKTSNAPMNTFGHFRSYPDLDFKDVVRPNFDSLYSIVQMPRGIPVATVAIGNAENAGLLAIQIIASYDLKLLKLVQEYRHNMTQIVIDKQKKLNQLGYENYLKKMEQKS